MMQLKIVVAATALFVACKGGKPNDTFQLDPKGETYAIEKDILTNDKSFYYIDVNNYFGTESRNDLAIGVFDSGTGGLTVLDALIRYDQNNNQSHTNGQDGIADFNKENFIYLGDQANMPYGNYFSAGKTSLLKEHVVKDIQFLLGNKYYLKPNDTNYHSDKQKIKAIVIACNTATAYGQAEADAFMARTGLNIPVIGVINAGTRGTLQQFKKDESGAIGVFATVGTIASDGYGKNIKKMAQELGYTGNLQIFNQGGFGLAEAVDEEPEFLNRNLHVPSTTYKGPSLSHKDFPIDKALLDVYNFNFDKDKMLCDSKNTDDCSVLQLNDAENYVRYHLVSLMEKIRKSKNPQVLKALVLGCTHYPYLKNEIQKVFTELYNYQDKNGRKVYQQYMAPHIKLIDPAEYVAKELYDALKQQNQFNPNGDAQKNSEFYISMANLTNRNVLVDDQGRMTYDYKYGRNSGEIQEYVKVTPFSKKNISEETLQRFKTAIPQTFELIKNFSQNNPKLLKQAAQERIN